MHENDELKKDEFSIKSLNIDASGNFQEVYSSFKSKQDKYNESLLFYHKLKMVGFLSAFVISIYFILMGSFLWITKDFSNSLTIMSILLFFGYTAFISFFFMKKMQDRYVKILFQETSTFSNDESKP